MKVLRVCTEEDVLEYIPVTIQRNHNDKKEACAVSRT